jgi:hypothetical protein
MTDVLAPVGTSARLRALRPVNVPEAPFTRVARRSRVFMKTLRGGVI